MLSSSNCQGAGIELFIKPNSLYFKFADMLTGLRVKNYALIKDLVFEPGADFNVITGETGAGKSILLGALGLILGDRADSVTVKENEEKCVVEGYFRIADYDLKSWFDENVFDYSEELIIRREILLGGKSRTFINDTPAQLGQTKELGRFLIDIHSQNENSELFQRSFQFGILDSFSGSEDLASGYRENFEELKRLERQLAEMEEKEKRSRDEREYKQFLFDELSGAGLIAGEAEALEEELRWLSHADNTLQALSGIYHELIDSESAITDKLAEVRNQLGNIVRVDKRFEKLMVQFSDAYYALKESSEEIGRAIQNIQADPERLESVNQRLAFLHQLERKHRGDDLFALRDRLELELAELGNLTSEMEDLKHNIQESKATCTKIASELSVKRRQHSSSLEEKVNEMIQQLGMTGATIRVEINPLGDTAFNQFGTDELKFLFSPARGKFFSPVQDIASGGEMSRLMLVFKYILARKKAMPTIIFDEIDAGVSGEVAFKMGEMLGSLSENLQLIAITHLPQIASKGKRHFYVYKKQLAHSTVSDIRELTGEERVKEIAEMMGGKDYGTTILASARQLLAN